MVTGNKLQCFDYLWRIYVALWAFCVSLMAIPLSTTHHFKRPSVCCPILLKHHDFKNTHGPNNRRPICMSACPNKFHGNVLLFKSPSYFPLNFLLSSVIQQVTSRILWQSNFSNYCEHCNLKLQRLIYTFSQGETK